MRPEEEKQSKLLSIFHNYHLIHAGNMPTRKFIWELNNTVGEAWLSEMDGMDSREEKPEQSIGLLDWHGYWLDDVPHEECNQITNRHVNY